VSVWFDKEKRTWMADCVFCRADLGPYKTPESAADAVRLHLGFRCPEMSEDDRKAALYGPSE